MSQELMSLNISSLLSKFIPPKSGLTIWSLTVLIVYLVDPVVSYDKQLGFSLSRCASSLLLFVV